MPQKKTMVVLGTRPEAIKLAPVILALKRSTFQCRVCVTGQHRQMLDQVLKVFHIEPDIDLNLMKPDQDLAELTARGITALYNVFLRERPDLVLVQGDTTTVLFSALAAFYAHIPLGHVEAGLRTGDLKAPWPEEGNRVLTSRLASLHFAPTQGARSNLLAEGIRANCIHVTGNTVIDALLHTLTCVREPDAVIRQSLGIIAELSAERRIVLITGHRRESFGGGFDAICGAISDLAERFPTVQFVYPVHLNPNVREPVQRILATGAKPNVSLLEPLPYTAFVYLMSRSYLLLTDSGGVQEEAPSLGKPVLVMRDTTERPEALAAGASALVGTDRVRIVAEVSRLLIDEDAYRQMSQVQNPYGDGHAADRILAVCRSFLQE